MGTIMRRRDTEALYEADEAVREALFGNISTAKQRSGNALELSKSRDVEYEAALALALSGDLSRSQVLRKTLQDIFRKIQGSNSTTCRRFVHFLH